MSEQETTPQEVSDMDSTESKIRFENIIKQFGRVVAINDLTLDIPENEIFALIGDNGAGKSTLISILNGFHQPTSGQVYYEGEPVEFNNPQDARELGIETVYQDLALMNDLDVATNIFMGMFPKKRFGPFRYTDWDQTYDRAKEIMSETLERDIPVDADVEFLSGGERQLVAIGRALAFEPDTIVLDEPTSALATNASQLVRDTIQQLKENGHTILIISHNIQSVLGMADKIGVMYQGELVTVKSADSTDYMELNNLMTTGSLGD